jgi:formimidoylglutamate deiminase
MASTSDDRTGMETYHFETALTDAGWQSNVRVRIDGRTITDVSAGVALPPSAMRRPRVAIPGTANVHSHAFQRAMAGLVERRGPEDDSFWTWRDVMYRFLACLTPDDVEAVAAWLYVEMLEAGFTSVGEFHYVHHAADGTPYADIGEMAGRIAQAASSSGIGLTLLPTFYAHGGCGGVTPKPGQRRFLCDVERFVRLAESARGHLARLAEGQGILGISPHSIRAVTPDEITALLAAFPSGPVHMHAAEQTAEVEECLAWSEQRPVEWLLTNASLDARWCLIHATHMTPQEITGLAQSGAVAGLCPITEANLGDGIFEAPAFMGAGGRMAVGSDSNVRIALGEELRTLEYGQRLRDRKRNRLGPTGSSTGRTLFDAAVAGGAQALGRRTGAIAVGQDADIVVLDGDHPVLAGRRGDAVLDALVFAGGDGFVSDVIAGGRHVVQEGRHIHRDALRARFTAVVTRLAAEV